MNKPVARRLKYAGIIAALDDSLNYSPASIARFAGERGLLAPFLEKETNEAILLQRIGRYMNRLRKTWEFPEGGDDQLRIPGQAPVPVWFGWRWKIPLSKGEF